MTIKIIVYIVFLALTAFRCAFCGSIAHSVMNPLERLPSTIKGVIFTRTVIRFTIIFAIFIDTGVTFIISCFTITNLFDIFLNDLWLAVIFVASYAFAMIFWQIGVRLQKKKTATLRGRP